MRTFLTLLGFINWLIVSVLFGFDSDQTMSLFDVFLGLFVPMMAYAFYFMLTTPDEIKEKLKKQRKPRTITEMVKANLFDISFFAIAAYIISAELQSNILLLMVAMRFIIAVVKFRIENTLEGEA